jgi:hypothetical protein
MSQKTEEADQSSDLKDRDLVQDVGNSEEGINNEDDDRPVKVGRKRDFGFIPIPESKRHDPNLKVHEQFAFTWRMNLILAGAAVSLGSKGTGVRCLEFRLSRYRIYTMLR